jgi:zinc D-Ala-D-Ala dipeptidase
VLINDRLSFFRAFYGESFFDSYFVVILIIRCLSHIYFLGFFFLFFSILSCSEKKGDVDQEKSQVKQPDNGAIHLDEKTNPVATSPKIIAISDLEHQMQEAGLINIKCLDSSIDVDMKYNGSDNFMHCRLYNDLPNAYLPLEVAQKLCKAQQILKKEHPNYSLIVFDAARPLSVQQYIWDSVKLKPYEKYQYISPPQQLSLHNYGAAVDLSIKDLDTDSILNMGTAFDFFGKEAQPRYEAFYLQTGKLTEQHLKNRQLLRRIMQQAGFYGITTEWWHFNSTNKWVAAKKYKLIE